MPQGPHQLMFLDSPQYQREGPDPGVAGPADPFAGISVMSVELELCQLCCSARRALGCRYPTLLRILLLLSWESGAGSGTAALHAPQAAHQAGWTRAPPMFVGVVLIQNLTARLLVPVLRRILPRSPSRQPDLETILHDAGAS